MTRRFGWIMAILALSTGITARSSAQSGAEALVAAEATIRHADGRTTETLDVLLSGDDVWLPAAEVAALFRAGRTWRADLQKMTFDIAGHRVVLAAGSEVAALDDDETVRLPGPVPYVAGVLYVPLALFEDADGAALDWLPERVAWNAETREVLVGGDPAAGLIEIGRSGRRGDQLDIVLDAAYDFRIVAAGRSRFAIRIPGAGLPDSLTLPDENERFLDVTARRAGYGVEVSFAVPDWVLGYHVIRLRRPDRISILTGTDERAVRDGRLTPFPEWGFGDELMIRSIVIDPGHGGSDPGEVAANGTREADVTLALAREVAFRLEDRLGIQAVLTRDADRSVGTDRRAEMANVAEADLFLSLHFDGFDGSRARGPRALVVRPRAGTPETTGGALRELGFHVWGESQRGHLDRAWILADRLVHEIAEARGQTPRGVEEWPLPILEAVAVPAVYLEVDVLSSPGASSRLTQSQTLGKIADAIVTAIEKYRREAP